VTLFAILLTTLTAAIAAEWVARNLLALRVWRGMFHLTPQSDTREPEDHWPPLTVVVAAKDEEDNINACLMSLLTQDYPRLDIVVINDRSEDRTGEIIDQLAREHTQLRAMHITELPEGWCGKNHAMQRGIETVTSEHILMTDADCTFPSSRALRVAMRYALDEKADMVSLLPTLQLHSFWEKLLLPVCGGILMIWFSPKRVNSPKSPRAYANGMFMLMTRDAYQGVGMHEAFKGSLIEDMDIARKVKASGKILRVAPTENLVSVRMYSTRKQITQGWNRIFYGVFQRTRGILQAFGVLVGRGLTLTMSMILAWLFLALEVGPANWWHGCALIATGGLIAQLVMTCRFYHHTRSSWPLGLLYPFTCSYAATMLLRVLWTRYGKGTIVWRDTHYDANEGMKGHS